MDYVPQMSDKEGREEIRAMKYEIARKTRFNPDEPLQHRPQKTACRPAGSRQSPNHRSSLPDGAAVASRTCFPRLPLSSGRGATAPAVMRAEVTLMSAPQRRSESVPC